MCVTPSPEGTPKKTDEGDTIHETSKPCRTGYDPNDRKRTLQEIHTDTVLLCKYDLRKGDLFVLSWTRVRRARRESLSSELIVCGGGVRSILLLPLVARCLETIDVCIWRMFVFMSVVVTVWGSVGMFVV